MADEFGGVPVESGADEFGGMPVENAPAPQAEPSTVSRLAGAFTSGFHEGFGSEPAGLSQQNFNWMVEHGVFRKESKIDTVQSVFQAFIENIIYPAAGLLDTASRAPGAVYRAFQSLGVEAGLPRDVVSLPDAFMGSPGGLKGLKRIEPPRPVIEGMPHVDLPMPGMPRSELARTGFPHVDAILQSEVTSKTIDNAVVDREHTIPYTAGGSVPLEDPTVFIDRRFPHSFTVDGVTFDPADPFTIHENVEQQTMETLIKGGMKSEEAYRVAHFEFAEKAEGAWYRAHGIDQEKAEAAYAPFMERIQHEGADNVPSNLYDRPYPHDRPSAAKNEPFAETRPSEDEIARAKDIIEKAQAKGDLPPRSFDAAPPPPPDPAAVLDAGRQLGVVGDRPRVFAEDAPPPPAGPRRAMAASRPPDERIVGPEPGAADPWRERFNASVDKLVTPDDIKQFIRDAADEHGDFLPARRGEIPLADVEDVARAAGVPTEEISGKQRAGIGRLLQNDAQVRIAIQHMLRVTDDVRDAARAVKTDDTPENLIALQQSIMRRDIAVEQYVGLRAEWGRTGNVFQEFMRDVKDQQGLTDFLRERGRTTDGLRDIAGMLDTLEPRQAARFMNDARKPNFWDKYIWYWTNALIAGPVTHAKYVLANAAFAGYEAGAVTPIAGVLGAAREAGSERVFVGEAAARTWGLLAGTPDALRAAVEAARKGIQVPLPGEVAKNVNPVINMRPQPIEGMRGTIIGIPSRGAAGIHSFFNFLGYRAELEAQAYRQAAQEGLSPSNDAFWQRRQQIVSNPAPEMMDKAIENAYHLSFISEQGELGKAVGRLANARVGGIQPFKIIFPFTHIPGNIMRAALEQTPAAFLDSRMRADLLGKNGAVAADTARARVIAGSAIAGMVASWAVGDNITGYGPTDQSERARWLLTHEPYSVRMGGWWVSYNRFGPIGDLMGMVANFADIAPKLKEGEITEAAGQITKAAAHLVMDEVGMQGLANIIEAMEDPDRKMARYLSSQAATNLPFSSALRQTASMMDPNVREAKTFIDGLRNAVPFARQQLLPRRDWLGQPLPNAGYAGGAAGGVLRAAPVRTDLVSIEVGRLTDFKPAPPQDRIGGVKLSPELFDQYQATAGGLAHMALDTMINAPGWHDLPGFIRESAVQRVIESSRKAGEASMQAWHPELILQGIQQKADYINGTSPTKRPKQPPQAAPPAP